MAELFEEFTKTGERIGFDSPDIDLGILRSISFQTQVGVPNVVNPAYSQINDDTGEKGTRPRIFWQNDIPTENYKEDDVWIKLNDNNHSYYANAALQWISYRDGTILEESDISLANLGEKSFASLTAGIITSKAITLAVAAGQGDVFLKSSTKTDFWATKILGDNTTTFNITERSGITMRYTYSGGGTDPDIETYVTVGSIIDILLEDANVNNNGIFTVTGVGTDYFEINNGAGVAETSELIGEEGKLEVGEPGFIIGIDDSDDDKSKLFIGNYNRFLHWDGNNLKIKGSLKTIDFRWTTLFESIDGFSVGGVGTQVVEVITRGVKIQTGATTDNTATLEKRFSGVPYFMSWNKERVLRCVLKFDTGTDQDATFKAVFGDIEPNQAKIGFSLAANGILKGIVANETSTTAIDLIIPISIGIEYVLEVRFFPADRCEFYVNGVFFGQITTNLPFDNAGVGRMLDVILTTKENAAKRVDIVLWEIWQEY